MLQWAVKCVVLFSEKYAIMAFAASYANPFPQCFCSQSNRVCLRYFQNKCLPCRYVRFCERLRIHNTRGFLFSVPIIHLPKMQKPLCLFLLEI